MWTGVVVLFVVAVLSAVAFRILLPPRRRGPQHSRGGGSVQPGRDYMYLP